jgi:hypothetical protein
MTRSHRRTLVPFLLLLTAIAAPVSAQSNDFGVSEQLDRAAEIFAADQLHPASGVFPRQRQIGALRSATHAAFEIDLVQGVEYYLLGVCDVDCSDIDLSLAAPGSGQTVAADLEPDDVPIITFTPAVSGRYTLRLDMVSCSGEPCYYGVMAFTR